MVIITDTYQSAAYDFLLTYVNSNFWTDKATCAKFCNSHMGKKGEDLTVNGLITWTSFVRAASTLVCPVKVICAVFCVWFIALAPCFKLKSYFFDKIQGACPKCLVIMPRPGGIKRWCCLTSVSVTLTSVWRLSRTSGRQAACAAGGLDGAYWLIGLGSAGLAQGCRCALPLQAWAAARLQLVNKLCAWRHDILRASPPPWAPQRASRATEQTQRSSSFPRQIRSHGHRCTCLTR